MPRSVKSAGFTLLEMMISLALGLLVLSAAVQLYSQAVKATWVTSERSEMQQDFRAASNLLARDLSMAGAGALGEQGLSSKSVALPVSATPSVYPCSSTLCNYVNGTSVAYPSLSGAHYLYSILPGNDVGITIDGQTSDIITVSYTDANLALNCYTVTYVSATSMEFTGPPPGNVPSTCILPTGVAVPQALNDPVVGLQTGDMILFSTTSGPAAVGVVTGNPTVGSVTCNGTQTCTTYTFPFANGDPGKINQPTVATGSLLSLRSASLQPAVRLLLITYYLDISPTDGVTPRLMRIQNGRTPAPVAENIVHLEFTYDAYNGGTVVTAQSTLPAGTTPGMITKINIAHMTIRSQLQGITGYQGLDLQTSIAARNLTFQQEYPISGSNY